MPESSVIIIGGGAAGLSAAATLTRRGIDAVVLEQDPQIGGTWARRYDRLRLHTVRRWSGLAHLPISSRYPTYLSRDEFVAYLREYVAQLQLRVMFKTTVRQIRTVGNPPGFLLDTADGDSWVGRVVVIATGQYAQPIVPPWKGRDAYRGRLSHSIAYSNAAPYAGQRVLVIGAGNSGAEIATDLCEGGAAYVALSVRTPPVIVPRDPFGMPVQTTSILLSALPRTLANRLGWISARLTVGDLTRYGIPEGAFTPYTTGRLPLIDVGLVDAVKHGRVQPRPALERLTEAGAVFIDGRHESFDAIIAATGFSTGLDRFLERAAAVDVLDDAGEPCGRSGDPTARPGLYFIGFTHSLRGHLFEVNRGSHRLARNVEQYLKSRRGLKEWRGQG